jgi:hypothetical protein
MRGTTTEASDATSRLAGNGDGGLRLQAGSDAALFGLGFGYRF